jgi:hypothetical protein
VTYVGIVIDARASNSYLVALISSLSRVVIVFVIIIISVVLCRPRVSFTITIVVAITIAFQAIIMAFPYLIGSPASNWFYNYLILWRVPFAVALTYPHAFLSYARHSKPHFLLHDKSICRRIYKLPLTRGLYR